MLTQSDLLSEIPSQPNIVSYSPHKPSNLFCALSDNSTRLGTTLLGSFLTSLALGHSSIWLSTHSPISTQHQLCRLDTTRQSSGLTGTTIWIFLVPTRRDWLEQTLPPLAQVHCQLSAPAANPSCTIRKLGPQHHRPPRWPATILSSRNIPPRDMFFPRIDSSACAILAHNRWSLSHVAHVQPPPPPIVSDAHLTDICSFANYFPYGFLT